MQDWTKLPIETLRIIFDYLNLDDHPISKKNLAECALCCRNWKLTAQELSFSKITLNNDLDMERLTAVVLKNKGIEKWVKSVTLASKFNWNVIGLLSVDTLFPNLENLVFQTESDFLYSLFYEAMIENNKFSHLRTLPKPIKKKQTELYCKYLDYVKNLITSIEIFDDFDDFSLGNCFYDILIGKLSECPKLKKIVINSPHGNFGYGDSLFSECFEGAITNKANELPPFQHFSLASIDGSNCLSLYTARQDTLLPTNSLKKLYIETNSKTRYTPCEQFLHFIMNSFSGLDTLICVNKEEKITEYRYEIPSNTLTTALVQFINFLSKMRYSLFPHISLPTMNALNLIKDYYVNINKESTTPTLRSLVIVNQFFNKDYHNIASIDIENSKRLKEQKITLRVIYKSQHENLDLELLTLIKQIGGLFDKLSLELKLNKNIFHVTSHIAKYCSRLSNLTLTGSGQRCDKRFDCKKDPMKNNSIKILTLSRFVLSQEQIFLIVNLLSSLEHLVLENCFMQSTAIGQFFFPICLPYLSLNCLEINLNTRFSEGIDGRCYYFKLTTDTDHNNPRYCFLTAKYKNKKTIGYSLIEDATESVFQANALNHNNNNNATYLISCKSVKTFTIKYIDAENGYHKRIDLISNDM